MNKKSKFTNEEIDTVSEQLTAMIMKQQRAKNWRNYKLNPFVEMLFTGSLLFLFLLWFLK